MLEEYLFESDTDTDSGQSDDENCHYGGRVHNGKRKASVWFPSVSLSFSSFFKQKMFCP